jgi:hypothetical protein
MKIVSINAAPSVCDRDCCIRRDVTDLNKILDNIDTAEGRNDALRAYIYALRDLQHAHNEFAFEGDGDDIDKAQAAVAKAFYRLVSAQFALDFDRGSYGE